MKSHLTYGFAALLGVTSAAWAIEPPVTPAPLPPQLTPEQAVAPRPVEPRAVQPEAIQPAAPLPLPAPAAQARPYLGISTSEIPELLAEHLGLQPGQGVVVRSLDPSGPAAQAGLQQNDVVTRVSGKGVGSHEQLRAAIAPLLPGDEVEVVFIHKGAAKSVLLALGAAPAVGIAGADPLPLERLRLDGMPQDQAQRLQDAIQENLRSFEGAGPQDGLAESLFSGPILRRMEQMMQGLDLQEVPQPGGVRSTGTIRMLNADGTGVEVRSEDGSKIVRVLGPGGRVEWEGPYNTPEEREAVPPQFRQRIESLNLDLDFKGQGLRLHMAPRYKPLEEGE